MRAVRAIAFYLPQFHPVPENDAWWGTGFTEWTNTANAKPLFRGHYQPHVPADLGFYDLRVAETRVAQAAMARRYGIEGFCYYHYWFAGRRILERPFAEVLRSGKPDFPFCLCWANQSWSGIWHGAPDRVLIEQTYPGRADHESHFEALLSAFADPRYIRVDGKPLFLIYWPSGLPDAAETLAFWRAMAAAAGLGGLHIVGQSESTAWDWRKDGFDARVDHPVLSPQRPREWVRKPIRSVRNQWGVWRELLQSWCGLPKLLSCQAFYDSQLPAASEGESVYPCLTHAWDNTPRAGRRGVVIRDTSPQRFRQLLDSTIYALRNRPLERRLLFLKSWNEWAEGNHLEPDLKGGVGYLRAVAEALGVTA